MVRDARKVSLSRSFRGSVPSSSSRKSRGNSRPVPIQDFFLDRKMKQRREKKSRNRETRPPWPDRGKYQSDWSRLSLVRSRLSALFPEVLMPLHTHHPGASGSEEHKRTETINRETRLTVAGPFVWYAAIR